MQRIHSEIHTMQSHLNTLMTTHQDYTQEVVPLTFRHYKDLKENYSYSTLPFDSPKLQNDSHMSS